MYLGNRNLLFFTLPYKVELLISCTELANLDTFSKTDPMCVLFVRQFGQWKEYGRTEAVLDALDPKVTKITICKQQNVMNIYNENNNNTCNNKN